MVQKNDGSIEELLKHLKQTLNERENKVKEEVFKDLEDDKIFVLKKNNSFKESLDIKTFVNDRFNEFLKSNEAEQYFSKILIKLFESKLEEYIKKEIQLKINSLMEEKKDK